VVHAIDLLLIAAFIALVARLALTNHRFADRSRWRVLRHAALLAAFATVRVVIVAGVAAASGGRW
jgi:hypothetical protein